MARILSVEIDGAKHSVHPVGGVVKLVVQDGSIERHLEFTAGGIEEQIVDVDGDHVESASSDYESLHGISAETYDGDEEDEDEEDEFDLDDDEDGEEELDGEQDEADNGLAREGDLPADDEEYQWKPGDESVIDRDF